MKANKMVKRRMNKTSQINLALVPDLVIKSKSILQLIKEQLIGDSQSSYKGYDVLYIVMIFNRKRGNNKQSVHASGVPSKPSTERYLILVKKPDSPHATLLKVIRKEEDELEVKKGFELLKLKTLDYGSEDTELIMSTEDGDNSLYFNNQGDRDETLWIIMQAYKTLSNGKELNVGYSVDTGALSYLVTNSGLLTRFPQLQKVVNLSESQMSEHFTTDELEAERVLNEIQWGSSFGAQKDLHKILSERSEGLNNNIINFLLQWEESDEAASQLKSNASSRRGSASNMHDTKDVLLALGQVDAELYAVDCWLGEQISRISKIKSNLHMIEDESGTLETSWTNLTVVQKVIVELINKYSISDSDEKLLRAPDTVVNSIFKSSTFSNIDLILKPLIVAATKLKEALVTKATDGKDGLSAIEWKQIQAITAIKEQKGKLTVIATEFTKNFNQTALSIFDMILKHKTLVDGDSSSSKVHVHVPTLIPKNFTTKAILEELSYSSVSVDITKYFHRRTNQLLDCQNLYHTHVSEFKPLIDLQVNLLSNLTRSQMIEQPIRDAYVRATQERLYAPLIKAFVKDIQTLVTLKQSPISLLTAGRYRIQGKNDPVVFFHQTSNKAGQSKLITSWKGFEVALMLLGPLLVSEEHFIKTTFGLDGRQRDDGGEISASQNLSMTIDEATFLHSRLYFMLESLFEEPTNRLLQITSAQSGTLSTLNNAIAQHDQHDGIESIAMLTTLSHIANSYAELIPLAEQDETAAKVVSSNLYLHKMFKTLRTALEQNIHAYTLEQIAWINSQRADAKAPGVLAPFTKFPSLVLQVVQMTNGLQFDSVDDLLMKLCKELLSWLATVSKQNEKYVDKVKIVNLVFFHMTISPMNVPILQSFVAYVQQQIQESTVRYVQWMVEYEFPSLSALAIRLDGVGKKVSDEDLSLYIRRKDVLNVIKELESKTLDSMVSSLAKRLEKHFKSEFDSELHLMSKMWNQIKERMVNILRKLEAAASISYQIELDVSPKDLIDLFDKYAQSLQSV